MAVGKLHIFDLGTHPGPYGEVIRDYQVNFNDAGNTFTGTMEEEKLKEFLITGAGVDGTEVERTIEELHRNGNTTLTDVEIPENEAGAMGLMQEPSDV